MAEEGHVPVLVREVVACLAPRPHGVYVDATFGAGGHTRALLAAAPCRVVGIDRDPDAVARGRRLADQEPRFRMLEGRFGGLDRILAEHGIGPVDGVLFDLGLSSLQLQDAARGFAFSRDGPLDMRMEGRGTSAADLVNRLDEQHLARLLWEFGEEPQARRIARAIVTARRKGPIRTTGELARLVAQVAGRGRGRLHPATRTFQALRIAVNDELGELERGLEAAARVLAAGGRMVVISYHSLEDRMVKRFLKGSGGGRDASGWRSLHRKVIRPKPEEVAANPRARSARLRAAERLAQAEVGQASGPAWGTTG